jgi:hypothetical protein
MGRDAPTHGSRGRAVAMIGAQARLVKRNLNVVKSYTKYDFVKMDTTTPNKSAGDIARRRAKNAPHDIE